ncbi:MAG: glucans biosynthesis glucosyltransferase MdoH, partial [Verrucomicrobiia bacterium]
LMRKAGWEVWLAWDLEGTYEEGPQSIIELAQRDRRWLQGNLQHTWLLFARGLHPANKVHLSMGILGYLASPLWFAFLLVGLVVVHRHNLTGLSVLPVDGWFNKWAPGLTVNLHGWLLFLGTMGILFAPKLFALLYAMVTPRVPRSFGGLPSILSGMLVETLVSALVAPIFMLFHTKFLVWMFLGKSVTWSAQVRGAVGTTWGQAVAAHTGHTVIGLIWAGIALVIDQMLFLWMMPVLVGMIFSIPLSVLTSRPSFGNFLLRLGMLVTPEDIHQPVEVRELIKRLQSQEPQLPTPEALEPFEGLSRAVVDPYVNAVHVSLQQGNPHQPGLRSVVQQLATKGPEAIDPQTIKQVLADPEWMLMVHRHIWTTPFGELAPWWRHVVDGYRKAL